MSRESMYLARMLVSIFREKGVSLEVAIAASAEVLAQHVSSLPVEEFERTKTMILAWLPQLMDQLHRRRNSPIADVPGPEIIIP